MTLACVLLIVEELLWMSFAYYQNSRYYSEELKEILILLFIVINKIQKTEYIPSKEEAQRKINELWNKKVAPTNYEIIEP